MLEYYLCRGKFLINEALPGIYGVKLEFDKIKSLFTEHCSGEYAKRKSGDLRIHTRKDYIELELKQS